MWGKKRVDHEIAGFSGLIVFPQFFSMNQPLNV
jgi:hypothetical protein